MAKKARKRKSSATDDGSEAWRAAFSTVMAKLRVWKRRVRSHSFWANVTSPRSIGQAFVILVGWIYTVVVKLPWLIAILVIGTIMVQGLTQHAAVINPISVPKDLSDRGYTSDVAGQRLHDAMDKYIRNVSSRRRGPEIVLHGDLPNIVVPTVGISLDAIVSSIRTLLRTTRSRTIGGEITAKDGKLWLRLRIDGAEFYASASGADLDKPDDLFAVAVQDVVAKISPTSVALTLRLKDPERALAFVNDTIPKLETGDEDLPWLYNIRGLILRGRKEYPAAIEALQTAIELNRHLGASHINLGMVYLAQNMNEAAAAEFTMAIAIEPNSALAHNNYASVLNTLQRFKEAEAEIGKALSLDKNLATAHNTRAEILRDTGRREEAIAEFKESLRLDPKNAFARRELDKLVPVPAATGTIQQQ